MSEPIVLAGQWTGEWQAAVLKTPDTAPTNRPFLAWATAKGENEPAWVVAERRHLYGIWCAMFGWHQLTILGWTDLPLCPTP